MDFLGNLTNTQLIGYVADGVRVTGENIWPLFQLVGLPVVFAIIVFVSLFIINATSPSARKRRRTSGGGYETDQYTAEQSAAIVSKIREIERRPGAGYP